MGGVLMSIGLIAAVADFASPPTDCKFLLFHAPDKADPEAESRFIDGVCAMGFGGMAGCVCSDGIHRGKLESWVEDENAWPIFIAAAKRLKERGMPFWLYDECGWPSGSAKDLTLRGHPELESSGYLVAADVVKGGSAVEVKMPPGIFRAAWACPLDGEGRLRGAFQDISEQVQNGRRGQPPEPFAEARAKPADADGRPAEGFGGWRAKPWTESFGWSAPPGGDWLVCAIAEDYIFEGTQAECKGMRMKFRYPNPMDPAAADRFLEMGHGAYVKRLGSDLGRYFTSTFTDEPSLKSTWERKMPYLVLPSCRGFAEGYKKKTGRDLYADIPYLIHEAAEGRAAPVRIDFWSYAGELIAKNFFGRISAWCRAHGFLSGGHLLGEEHFASNVSNYGDFFQSLRALDAPSIDILSSVPDDSSLPVSWLVPLYAGSARALNGAKYAMCEISNHLQLNRKPVEVVSDADMRGTFNRLLWGGINTFVYCYEQIPGDQLSRLNAYVSRINTLLRDGTMSAETALLYPAEDIMAFYRPLRTPIHAFPETEKVSRLEKRFYAAAGALYENRRPFMVVDGSSLEKAKVEGCELVCGNLRWKSVVVMGRRHSEAAERKLNAFAAVGGRVVRPKGDDPVQIAETILAAVPEVFRVSTTEGESNALRVGCRHVPEGDVVFVCNDTRKPWKGRLRPCCASGGKVVRFDPWKGERETVEMTVDGEIELALDIYGSCVLLLSGAVGVRAYSGIAVDVSNLAADKRFVKDMLCRRVAKRTPFSDRADVLKVTYAIDDALEGDDARVKVRNGEARISAGRFRGLLFGTGRLLRAIGYGAESFSLADGDYDFRPKKSFRMAYYARHFLNWYMSAPIEELIEYTDDLALGGINGFEYEFAMPEVDAAWESPEETARFERLSRELHAHVMALDCSFCELGGANQLPDDSPEEFRGVPNTDPRRGNLGFNACPAKPGALEAIFANRRRALSRLEGVRTDYLVHWPFDEGGCECATCRPWGGKGYLKLIEQLNAMNKKAHPEAKAIVSTWVFHDDDFEGLYRYLETHDWVDYVMCDAHEDFPKYPLEHKLPGRAKIVTFPEISMWGRFPWGGYGAIMMPARFERLFRQAERAVEGFVYYSEGIFEDVNKVVVADLYVDPSLSFRDILCRYCAYEFPGADAGEFIRLAETLEANQELEKLDAEKARLARQLANSLDGQILPSMRKSWRWRLIYLRAMIDAEIAESGTTAPQSAKPYYDEIVRIYHAERQVRAVYTHERNHEGWTCPRYHDMK